METLMMILLVHDDESLMVVVEVEEFLHLLNFLFLFLYVKFQWVFHDRVP